MTAAAQPDGAGPAPRKIGNRNYRASRPELKLVGDPEEEATRISPSTFKDAKGSCPHCGYRALSVKGHPIGKLSGVAVCLLPPELRSAEL